MAYRNRNNDRRGNYGGGQMSRNVNPWDNNMGNGRQGGGGGGGGGMMNQSGYNADVLSLANNLVSNFFRNQGGPMPSLLDLPGNDGRGGGYGGGNYGRSNAAAKIVAKIGNRSGGNNRNLNNRRQQGGGGGVGARNGGVRKPNSKDRAKNVLAKNSSKKDSSDNKKNESDDKENGGSRKNKIRDSPYSNLPNDLFYCHMCMKHMWDSTSFENHIKGRSHQMMKEGIEESYRLRANMIRQEAKIMEQLKGIEIDRMKRLGKNLKASNQHRDYCTMCDLHFYGNLTTHRKTDGHINLKKFLHPRCTDCSIEYPNRTDFDDHLLSPEHMGKLSKKASRLDKAKKNHIQILTEADELQGLKPKEKKVKKSTKKDGEDADKTIDSQADTSVAEGEKGEAMETENGEGDEEGGDGEAKEGEDDNDKAANEPEDVILDYVDGQEVPIEVDAKIPKYNHTRPLAASMIGRLECYECRLCGRFFDTEKTAEIHSRTIYHYRQFTKFLNEKSNETRIALRRAEAAAEEEERRKRQKLEDEAEAAGDANASKTEEGDLYDPSEATADDDEKMDDSNANGDENGDAEVKEEAQADDAEVVLEEVEQEPEPAPAPEPEPSPAKGKTTGRNNSRAASNRTQTNTPRGGSRGRGRYNKY